VWAFVALAGVDVEKLTDRPNVPRLGYVIPKLPSIHDAAVQALGFDEFNVIIPAHFGAPRR
jgi:hypothetical protein